MRKRILAILILWAGNVFCQTPARSSSIGYAYPAGGRQGTVVQVTVGGQYLRGVSGIHVSGGGVTASDIKHIPMLNALQKEEFQKRIREIRIRQRHAMQGRQKPLDEAKKEALPGTGKPAAEEKPVVLPAHPLLANLENLTPYQLNVAMDIFIPTRRLQVKRAIQEMVIFNIEIEPGAEAGVRELRLRVPGGLTNPVYFEVGTVAEALENEPDDPGEPGGAAVDLPVVFNGQVMPADVDIFRFNASSGQDLVIEAKARDIVPYMADAVPGWFQAVMTLYDSEGREVAYSDDYLFRPDPVILYKVPRDGQYTLEIRDSIYRGREDFVYRVHAGEKPFVTNVFPLGGRTGEKVSVSLEGRNLPFKSMLLDTSPGSVIRQASVSGSGQLSNMFYYAVDDYPGTTEKETGGDPGPPQQVSLPTAVNGRISRPGDTDVFMVNLPAGYRFYAEVYGRRLGSPIDSFLRLTDSSGKEVACNDDNEDPSTGLNTHHADSMLEWTVESAGKYYLHVFDVQGRGGAEYGYRLRVGPSSPDFELRSTFSAVSVPSGSSNYLKINAVRKRGFAGDIELALEGESHGFSIGGGRIPAGRDSVRITIEGPAKADGFPVFPLRIAGRAVIDGREVTRRLVACDETMQAFAYFHLVPVSDLAVILARPSYRSVSMEIRTEAPLMIPPGGSSEVSVSYRSRMEFDNFIAQLKEPAEGISVSGVTISQGSLSFSIKADASKVKPGFADNVIVEIFSVIPVGKPDAEGVRRKQKISLGVIPAIPIEITGTSAS